MARSPGSAPSWLPGALESESWTEAGGGRGSVPEARGFEPQKGILICMETFISGQFGEIGTYPDDGGGWKFSGRLVYLDVLSL